MESQYPRTFIKSSREEEKELAPAMAMGMYCGVCECYLGGKGGREKEKRRTIAVMTIGQMSRGTLASHTPMTLIERPIE
jgi:hypothetical protein